MPIKKISCSSLNQLSTTLKKEEEVLILSGRTGTVIPYEKIDNYIGDKSLSLLDISSIPPKMELTEEGHLRVNISSTWKEARSFLRSKSRDLKCAPTEELAFICAGVATSATGERSFGFGPFRNQIVKINYMTSTGDILSLDRENDIPSKDKFLEYQKDWQKYEKFKNAPFPRLEREVDIMIATEGQLGVVTEVEFETTPLVSSSFFIIELPQWTKDYHAHLEIFNLVQEFRSQIISCELMDWNSLKHITDLTFQNHDLVSLEVNNEDMEELIDTFFTKLKSIDLEAVSQVGEDKFDIMRKGIPRATAEYISRNNLIKKGTDIQIGINDFEQLLNIYREGTQLGVDYLLFGHFGDAHLHFNFLPKKDQVHICDEFLDDLYVKLQGFASSPFAEHGIGIIKQKFIKPFLGKNQFEAFRFLKEQYDPQNKFFPYGFLNLKK